MSRIDEALRRVASGGLATSPGPLSAEERPVLDRYAPEGSPPAVAAPVPHARGARSHDAIRLRAGIAPRGRWPGRYDPAFEGKLVISRTASPAAVLEYRRLATAIHDLQGERGFKTLMVTSARPGDGTTVTAANLALTLSEGLSERVLLLDANLRRPALHAVFGLPNTRGLCDVLRSECDEVSTFGVSGSLSILPAGRPDSHAMAALTSVRMEALVDQMAAHFDWVLFDTTPVAYTRDAPLLARIARAVLFVIRAGGTPYPLVQRALADLGPDCVVGTVLNRVTDHQRSSSHGAETLAP